MGRLAAVLDLHHYTNAARPDLDAATLCGSMFRQATISKAEACHTASGFKSWSPIHGVWYSAHGSQQYPGPRSVITQDRLIDHKQSGPGQVPAGAAPEQSHGLCMPESGHLSLVRGSVCMLPDLVDARASEHIPMLFWESEDAASVLAMKRTGQGIRLTWGRLIDYPPRSFSSSAAV